MDRTWAAAQSKSYWLVQLADDENRLCPEKKKKNIE